MIQDASLSEDKTGVRGGKLDTGYKILDTRYRIQNTEYQVSRQEARRLGKS